MRTAAGLIVLATSVLLLTGCQTLPSPVEPAAQTRPAGHGRPALPAGREFVVDSRHSEIRVVVYPDGPMARLGHPHVIGGHVVDGRVVLAEPFESSALELSIDVRAMELDRPDWRLAEGFDPDIDPDAIEATRRNLIAREQLDAASHPFIRVRALALSGPKWQPDIRLQVTIKETVRELTVPVALHISDQALSATGRIIIRQSDFDIEPFSAAGGALRVADPVMIRFHVVARPTANDDQSFRG